MKLAPTRAALAFFDPAALPRSGTASDALSVRGQSLVYLDDDEWPRDRLFLPGEPVLHIELRRWADLFAIAPLDANTLAKLAAGLCDNLLTCVYRAWEPSRPVLLAPAMNTLMWEHPATVRCLKQIAADFGVPLAAGAETPEAVAEAAGLSPRLRIVLPQSKRLACGDEGMGALAAVDDIAATVEGLLALTTENR